MGEGRHEAVKSLLRRSNVKPIRIRLEIKDTYNTGKNEFDAVTGSVANSAMLAGAQGVLGLIGCIIAFIALGKGNKAVVGGILLTLAVVASLWALEFSGVGISTILHLIAAIMAFVAAPKVMAEA